MDYNYYGNIANGSIVERYAYDAFGKCTVHTSKGNDGIWMTTDDTTGTTSSIGNPFMFTGREYDNETGNYYYRNRYYNPTIGRFLQTDPVRSKINLYPYCENNPVNWIDPWGLAEILVRPLDRWYKHAGANIMYGKEDISGQHWQIFYGDGTNSGYFGNGKDAPVFGSDDPRNMSSYRKTPFTNWDDERMRRAESIVQDRWSKEYKEGKRKYSHPENDCHTYIIEVTEEYRKLPAHSHKKSNEKEIKKDSGYEEYDD